MTSPTALPFSAASDRNRHPIGQALATLLPAQARVLEVASGSGQHAQHLASLHPDWHWQPTEANPQLLPAIDARCHGLPNVAAVRLLDVAQAVWPAWPAKADGQPADQPAWDAVYTANLLHISPWAATLGLLAGAAAQLQPGGLLLVYGPFLVDGEPTAPSNLAFDADLKARNPAWGLRRQQAVQAEAEVQGLRLEQALGMPANNRLLVIRRL